MKETSVISITDDTEENEDKNEDEDDDESEEEEVVVLNPNVLSEKSYVTCYINIPKDRWKFKYETVKS